MADLFTLTYTPPPPSQQTTHSTEAKFLVPYRGDKVDFGIGLWLVVDTVRKKLSIRATPILFFSRKLLCRGGYFFAAQQRIAITLSPEYYQKMQRSTTRKNQEEHGPEVK